MSEEPVTLGWVKPPGNEAEERAAVVAETKTWLGTPYHPNADVKGAGVDCGMILVRVFGALGFIDPIDPRPYPIQWPLHQASERYIDIIKTYARELPEGQIGGMGDVVVFRLKNMRVHHHGGIITEWPWIIHATPPGPVMPTNALQDSMLTRLAPKFFSIWPR